MDCQFGLAERSMSSRALFSELPYVPHVTRSGLDYLQDFRDKRASALVPKFRLAGTVKSAFVQTSNVNSIESFLSCAALVATLSLVSVVTFTASQPAPLPAVIPLTPAPTQSSDLADLPAYEVIPLLCNRNVTARQYVQALLDRYQAGGYECLNMWINFNATKVHVY